MSGHSRWAQIHRQKGAADSKRGVLFTKLANAITVAAREGGENPDTNFKLRLTIDQARMSNMPKENIERAIKRGSGQLEGGRLEEITYEGFGPSKSAFIIECVTDNRNRTSGAIKHLFSKYGGQLAQPNSVLWQFERKGSIGIVTMNEGLELALIDAGATDIQKEDERYTAYCLPHDLEKIKNLLETKKEQIEFAEVGYVAKEKNISKDQKEKEVLEKFMEELDNNQDVKNYYTNA